MAASQVSPSLPTGPSVDTSHLNQAIQKIREGDASALQHIHDNVVVHPDENHRKHHAHHLRLEKHAMDMLESLKAHPDAHIAQQAKQIDEAIGSHFPTHF